MEDPPPIRAELRVHGRVQGVGFRWATRQEARLLGLSGWVRNEPDGSVFLVVEGAIEPVQALERWCATGPARARVDRVERRSRPPAGDLPDPFEVRV